MRHARFWLMLLAVLFSAGIARAYRLDGSVTLYPIDTSFVFRSYGNAKFVNDLNEPADANLSGEHRVEGGASFVVPVTGNGSYAYVLEGPADPLACYATSLSVRAEAGLLNSKEGSWSSGPKCAPREVQKPPGGYGNQEGNGSDSPIVINFAKGGYELTGAEAPIEFDIQATGQPVRIGWTAPGADEALLCLDRNQNGTIDNGAELFGDATPLKNGQRAPQGFAALAELDDNHDGVIDRRDAVWSRLLLWRDLDHDGIAKRSEVSPVAGSALAAINLDAQWTGRRDSSGNMFRYEAAAWISDDGKKPSPRPVYDIFFVPVPN